MLLTLALVLLTILALLLVVSGRGGWRDRLQAASDALTSSDASTSSVQTPAGTTPGAASASPTTTRGGGGFSRIVQWLNDQAPLGGGAGGALDAAFSAMLEGDCRGALRMSEAPPGEEPFPEPGRTLYEGAGSACLAAFEGRPELWPRAEAAFEKTVTHVSAFDCEQQTVYRLLARLVGLHRTEPNVRLVKELTGRRGELKCPRFTKIAPDHGPPEGGYPIYLEGENLPRVVVVNLQSAGGLRAVLKAESIDGRHVTIIAPPHSNEGGSIYVWPSGAHWPDEYRIEFVYDDPLGAKTQPSTTTTKPQVTSPASTTTTTPSPPSS
jgi:hypothetical protein